MEKIRVFISSVQKEFVEERKALYKHFSDNALLNNFLESVMFGVEYGYEDKIIDLTHKLNSFKKTASFIDQLDLVISSDTSVAHLSGALNKEVWIPLQKVPDWRWANKGEKSHWYPSAKLFRQKTNRVWDSVFQSIYAKLGVKFKIKIK